MGYDLQTIFQLVQWGVSVDLSGYPTADIKKVLPVAANSGAMVTIQAGYPAKDLIQMAQIGGKSLTIRPQDKQ